MTVYWLYTVVVVGGFSLKIEFTSKGGFPLRQFHLK